MLQSIIKIVFLTQATFEIGRERLEDCLDVLAQHTDECKEQGSDCLQETKAQLSSTASLLSNKIQQRSEWLEKQLKEKIGKQIADFSLNALEDAQVINELKEEVACLRAEISEMKAKKVAV